MGRKKNFTCEVGVAEKMLTPLAQRLDTLITDTSALKDHLGCSSQAINQFKLGMSRPSLDNLCKIADFYGVSVDYLLGRTDVKKPDTNTQAVCEYTGLSEGSIQWLSGHKNKTDILNILITHPWILDDLWAYLTVDVDSIMEISQDENGQSHFFGEYRRFFGAMDSKKGKGIPVLAPDLNWVFLRKIEDHLKELKDRLSGEGL